MPAAAPSAIPTRKPTPIAERAESAKRGRTARLAKAGAAIGVAAVTSFGLSSCSPPAVVWPLTIPASVSQGFHPGHPGVDLYAPWGTPIRAATSGTASQAGWWYGYGNYTCIVRDAGFRSCYGHQSAIFVRPGQRVSQGAVIGLVGQTGYATGPHLHFEIYRFGQVVDPLPYIL